MKRPKSAAEAVEGFEAWLGSEIGSGLLEAEQKVLDELLPTKFGYYGLQISYDRRVNLVYESPVRTKFVLSPIESEVNSKDSLVADASELPFEEGCFDLLVLHHVLEFSPRPHQVLREAARVLRPSGYLVVLGFNPYSLWRMSNKLSFSRRRLPPLRQTIATSRMTDWFELLDLTEVSRESVGFQVPLLSRFASQNVKSRLATRVAKYVPSLGAAYISVARKDPMGMTKIKRSRFRRPFVVLPPVRVPETAREQAFEAD
ncbi:MAG: methyltransferase domain-containing protein [Pontibacterium sp.]